MAEASFTTDKENLKAHIVRVFNAPRQKVWEAFTTPEAIEKWWGPRDLKTTVIEMDVRVGGKWRFMHEDPSGKEFGFYGEYTAVEAPEHIAQTFIFEPYPNAVMNDDARFEELPDGRTKLIGVSTFSDVTAFEGMVGSGMEKGLMESYERLDELVSKEA